MTDLGRKHRGRVLVLRWLRLIERCRMEDAVHKGFADDACILCHGRGWVPTRLTIQAMLAAMSRDVQKVIHPYDLWAAAEQVADAALGEWEETQTGSEIG